MTRQTLAGLGLLTLLAITMVLGIAGCGSEGRTAPGTQALATGDGPWARVTGDPAENTVDQVADKGNGNGNGNGTGNGNSNGSGAGNGGQRAVTVFQVVFPVDGDQGAVIPFGRYILTFPAGAFSGTKLITIESDNAGYVECRLYPEGLKFKKPVNLSVNLVLTTGDSPTTTVYWYDPVAATWVDMGGVYDPLTHTVNTKLEHFSTYRAGRAGW